VGRGREAPLVIRAMVPPGAIEVGAEIVLAPEDAQHLKVRRVPDGAEGRVLDGRGGVGMGAFHRRGDEWLFGVVLVVQEPRPAETVLAVGAGDRDRFLLLAEKVAEFGVTRLIPIETTHTRSVSSRVRDTGVDKARRRAREACKQSGNAWVPMIDDLRPLEGLRDALPAVRWLVADPEGGQLPAIGAQEAVGWLIGPEAGFGLEEIDLIDNVLGATRVCLGQHTMRFETAAIAAAVVTDLVRIERVRQRRG
jgi:RsmE family RNA methyltransferase